MSGTSNFNIADIGERNTKITRYERIKLRLDALNKSNVKPGLDTWQRDMVASFTQQFSERRDLSDKQFKILLEIWIDAHGQGLVQLPKGKI